MPPLIICCTNKLRVIREIPFRELMEHIMEYGLLEKEGMLLRYVENQTPEICMAAVRQNGLALQYVCKQTPEICMVAVQQDVSALKYVKEQTPEIQKAAVWQIGLALQYVYKPTPEICMAAVQQDSRALQYDKDRATKTCLIALKQYYREPQFAGDKLQHAEDQTVKSCPAAIHQDDQAFRYAKEQTPEIRSAILADALGCRKEAHKTTVSTDLKTVGRGGVNGTNRIDTSRRPKNAASLNSAKAYHPSIEATVPIDTDNR